VDCDLHGDGSAGEVRGMPAGDGAVQFAGRGGPKTSVLEGTFGQPAHVEFACDMRTQGSDSKPGPGVASSSTVKRSTMKRRFVATEPRSAARCLRRKRTRRTWKSMNECNFHRVAPANGRRTSRPQDGFTAKDQDKRRRGIDAYGRCWELEGVFCSGINLGQAPNRWRRAAVTRFRRRQ